MEISVACAPSIGQVHFVRMSLIHAKVVHAGMEVPVPLMKLDTRAHARLVTMVTNADVFSAAVMIFLTSANMVVCTISRLCCGRYTLWLWGYPLQGCP